MTTPADQDPDGLRDGIESLLSEADERNERIQQFVVQVRMIGGPLGVLLRTTACMYEGFCEAEQVGGVTAGEETRMWQILDAAMDATDYLNGMDL